MYIYNIYIYICIILLNDELCVGVNTCIVDKSIIISHSKKYIFIHNDSVIDHQSD